MEGTLLESFFVSLGCIQNLLGALSVGGVTELHECLLLLSSYWQYYIGMQNKTTTIIREVVKNKHLTVRLTVGGGGVSHLGPDCKKM